MAELEVIKMGHPKLREISEEVPLEKIGTPEFQKFLKDLIETMQKANGAGIAAVQVGVLQRVFVMEMTENPRYPDKASFPLFIAINPTIEILDDAMVDSWEGCLSIPNIRGKLQRHSRIRLNATDGSGKQFSEELSGFAAIVAQHELDHLNGMMLIDRMNSMETLTFQKEYEKYWL